MRVAVLGAGPSLTREMVQALVASDIRMGVVCLESMTVDIEAFGLCPPTDHLDFGIELIRRSIPQWEPENSYCPSEFLEGFNTAILPILIATLNVQPFFKEHYEDE